MSISNKTYSVDVLNAVIFLLFSPTMETLIRKGWKQCRQELTQKKHKRLKDSGNNVQVFLVRVNYILSTSTNTYDTCNYFWFTTTLPLPKTTTGLCFYNKMWLQPGCSPVEWDRTKLFFLWNESISKRGSDEIVGGLKIILKSLMPRVLFRIIVAFWMHLLNTVRFNKLLFP